MVVSEKELIFASHDTKKCENAGGLFVLVVMIILFRLAKYVPDKQHF